MAHAVKGDYIRIRDTNCADWVKLGETYKVNDVKETDDEFERCFYLDGVDISWHADECNYTIVNKHHFLLEEAARRYPRGTHYLDIGSGGFGDKYSSSGFPPKVFDYVKENPRISVENGGGLVYTNGIWAPIVHSSYQSFKKGDTVVRWREVEDWEWKGIGDIECPPIGAPLQIYNVSSSNGLDKLPSIDLGIGWFPATAFVLSKYYNQSITNRGTADTLNTTDHVKSKISTGICIEVQRSSASIVTGERRTGSTISGRGDAAIVRRGHPRHKTIFGI